ncbi:MAG: hypothetical protein LBK58_02170 [Prevotellaceae bacterium]|nr:hypothetical protein [Prevotellaceae bacterium]
MIDFLDILKLALDSSPYGVVTERSFTPNCACGLFEVIHIGRLTASVHNAQKYPAHSINKSLMK